MTTKPHKLYTFFIRRDKKGQFYWISVHLNTKKIEKSSEQYHNHADCVNELNNVITAIKDGNYEIVDPHPPAKEPPSAGDLHGSLLALRDRLNDEHATMSSERLSFGLIASAIEDLDDMLLKF